MANLKEVRNRIQSVSSTQQITSAMKMVSAAKLKRAQDAIQQMRPYAKKLKEVLENVCADQSTPEDKYSARRELKKVLLVVITSNRGLCGGFNANIIKKATHLIRTEYKSCEVKVLCIGKKASDYFKKSANLMVSSHNELFDALNYKNTAPIAEKIMQDFASGNYDKIELVYNQFKNAAVQLPQNEQFLPVQPPSPPAGENKNPEAKQKTHTDYLFEPDKEQIVQDLIPRSLKIQLYKALLDSQASEHGARMTAMHKATDNAKDLIKTLKLNYNKARQAAITGEILEIVGGSEALNG